MSRVDREHRFPIGTMYLSGGKHGRIYTVTGQMTTTNHEGKVVARFYSATCKFMGQVLTDSRVVETSIAMGIERLRRKGGE